MCDEGESQQQLLERFEAASWALDQAVPYTGPDGSEGADLYLDRDAFRETFAADVDPETAAVMAAAQRRYAAAAFAGMPSGPPAWKTLPCWYLLGTEDKAIRRRSSTSWPSAPTQRSWRCRLSRLVRVAARGRHSAHPPGRGGGVVLQEAVLAVGPAKWNSWSS